MFAGPWRRPWSRRSRAHREVQVESRSTDLVKTLHSQDETQGLTLDAATCARSWLGKPIDVCWAIDALHPLANPRRGMAPVT